MDVIAAGKIEVDGIVSSRSHFERPRPLFMIRDDHYEPTGGYYRQRWDCPPTAAELDAWVRDVWANDYI